MSVSGLIETLWNVNYEVKVKRAELRAGLIETLWNVNCSIKVNIKTSVNGLIETLWNVNTRLRKRFCRGKRFNRNIVECK